jgi:hypothetical protein
MIRQEKINRVKIRVYTIARYRFRLRRSSEICNFLNQPTLKNSRMPASGAIYAFTGSAAAAA